MEPYNYHESNKDPNEELGQSLFYWMYLVKAPIAYIIGIFLYLELLEVYDSKVGRDKDFPFQFFTLLASVYIGALYLTDMVYYCYYNWNNRNVFIDLKMTVMTIPVMFYVLFIVVKYATHTCTCMSNTTVPCLRRLSSLNEISSNIRIKALVGLLTLAIVLFLLNVFPTLLLFFAHPMNTLALLVIHVALFYAETMAGMLVIKRLNKCECCKRDHHQGSSTEQSTCNTNGVMLAIWVVLALIGLVIIVIVYTIAMCFYHILFLRSLINNLAYNIFIKYIPGAGIAVFGYKYLKTFSNKKKEEENEKLRLKLEVLLNISEDHLKKLRRRPLANYVHNQSDRT